MKLFKKIETVASGACKIAAAVADTGLFAGDPVVSRVLNVASSIAGKIEEREQTDTTLETLHGMLSGIAPVVNAQVGAATELGGTPPALIGALRTMKDTLEDVQGKVDSYLDTWDGLKYVVAKSVEKELDACLEELDRQLHLVSLTITGQKYVRTRRRCPLLLLLLRGGAEG
jgi:hypothetical protein